MSIKDAWAGSFPLRVLLSFIATIGAAAVLGMITLIGDVRENTALLREFKASTQSQIDNHAERLRYLERARRGLLPGEP